MVKKKFKNNIIFGVFIIGTLISLIIVASNLKFNIADFNIDIDDGDFYRPEFGQLECVPNNKVIDVELRSFVNDPRYFEEKTPFLSISPELADHRYVKKLRVSCNNVGNLNCYVNHQMACSSVPSSQRLVIAMVRKEFKINSGSWQPFTAQTLTIPAGKTYEISTRCAGYGSTSLLFDNINQATPVADIDKDGRQLRWEIQDTRKQGFLFGTESCLLVNNAEVRNLVKIQEENPDIRVGRTIPFGKTENIIVNWKRDTTFRNTVNYNGRLATCQSFDGIYLVNNIELEGGKNIYVADDKIKSFNSGEDCCSGRECGTGKCENFKCVVEVVDCSPYGKWTNNDISYTNKPVYDSRTGKSYLETKRRTSDGCIDIDRKAIGCTQEECDFEDAGSSCTAEGVCEKVIIKQPCPPGNCCENSALYFDRGCNIGQECCLGEVNNNPSLGKCNTECSIQAEDCTDGIDNDIDGAIDGDDPDCLACTIDGENIELEADKCCEAQGYRWVNKQSEQGIWKFTRTVDESYCDKTPIWLLPVLFVGGITLVTILLLTLIFPNRRKKK